MKKIIVVIAIVLSFASASTVQAADPIRNQIDSCCAVEEGITEMLLQSHLGELHLLAALPDPWRSGYVQGIKGRGGYMVDIEWDKGNLSTAKITSSKDGLCSVRSAIPLTVNGQKVQAKLENSAAGLFYVYPIDMKSGESYLLQGDAASMAMMYYDDSRKGVPFSKDPSVVKFHDDYLMYYSLPMSKDESKPWSIGIAKSSDLINWQKIGELCPTAEYECEQKGICAPCALVKDDVLHIFYQTYNNGAKDAICHAYSADGVNFVRNSTNPVFSPKGKWNCGRAIDAEVVEFGDKYFLYFATRDRDFKVQMLGGAVAQANTTFSRGEWKEFGKKSLLQPLLEWEGNCIEAPSVIERNGKLYMAYAGNYNNHPQQIGMAESTDGYKWTRISDTPLLSNGQLDEWNSSESGHPALLKDGEHTYLFFQGNNDNGNTWYLSKTELIWNDDKPSVIKQ